MVDSEKLLMMFFIALFFMVFSKAIHTNISDNSQGLIQQHSISLLPITINLGGSSR